MTHISQRPLTVDEWAARLATAEGQLDRLERDIAQLIVWANDDSRERVNVIHDAMGALGNLRSAAALARRRIEKGLV